MNFFLKNNVLQQQLSFVYNNIIIICLNNINHGSLKYWKIGSKENQEVSTCFRVPVYSGEMVYLKVYIICSD